MVAPNAPGTGGVAGVSTVRSETALSQAEAVCLALVATGATHGWAVVRALDPQAELGAVWSLSRQLTYRALEQLVAKALLSQTGREPGRGRGRVLIELTQAGGSALHGWLDTPAAHIRDVRSETLLKLMLRERLGLDNVGFLQSQRTALKGVIEVRLSPTRERATYAELLRREQAIATQRFLDRALNAAQGLPAALAAPEAPSPSSSASPRPGSSLTGVVTQLDRGEALATVRLRLDDAQMLTTVVLDEDVDRLGLHTSGSAVLVVKPTDVVLLGA